MTQTFILYWATDDSILDYIIMTYNTEIYNHWIHCFPVWSKVLLYSLGTTGKNKVYAGVWTLLISTGCIGYCTHGHPWSTSGHRVVGEEIIHPGTDGVASEFCAALVVKHLAWSLRCERMKSIDPGHTHTVRTQHQGRAGLLIQPGKRSAAAL